MNVQANQLQLNLGEDGEENSQMFQSQLGDENTFKIWLCKFFKVKIGS